MNVFCMYVFGGGYGPIIVGAVSDALGGGAHGLKMGLMFMAVPGIVSAVLYFLSARHYYADMERVRHLAVMAEE